MKHLKAFESFEENKIYIYQDYRSEKYKVDDYVYMEESDWTIEPVVKILDHWWNDEANMDDYEVEAVEEESGKLTTTTIGYYDIKRKCTQKEIEEFELQKIAKKYNV